LNAALVSNPKPYIDSKLACKPDLATFRLLIDTSTFKQAPKVQQAANLWKGGQDGWILSTGAK
jgi:hypothetical protein